MNPRRVLVLGGAGFLGSHLCERLVRDGHHVVALDDFSTGSRSNVSILKGEPRFTLTKRDVRLPIDVEGTFDWVFNLASPASPVHYQRDPVKTTLTNVLGTLHALELAVRCHARLLQASTSEVYGDPEVHPQPEGYWGHVNPIGVRSCYDEGKRCAESLASDFVRAHKLELRLARIFNTYGPRMAPDDGRVVSNFIVQALRGEDLTVYGDGSQTRSFCYVDDLIEGFMRFIQHPSEAGPVNLGNSAEFTVLELARRTIELTGSRSRIIHLPLPKDDPKVRRPDLTRASEVLGYAPEVSLREGLMKTIESFRQSGAWSRGSRLHMVKSAVNAARGAASSSAHALLLSLGNKAGGRLP
jgi:UDP-glucuronate decarboxylase